MAKIRIEADFFSAREFKADELNQKRERYSALEEAILFLQNEALKYIDEGADFPKREGDEAAPEPKGPGLVR